jgi:hypothetical protein
MGEISSFTLTTPQQFLRPQVDLPTMLLVPITERNVRTGGAQHDGMRIRTLDLQFLLLILVGVVVVNQFPLNLCLSEIYS